MADNDRSHGRRLRRAAGCVVYRVVAGEPHFLLIRDPYDRWTLPKGHLEGKETEQEAAVREVMEETGVAGELGPQVGVITYTFANGGRLVEKVVTFFLMRAESAAVTPQASEGISAAAWFPGPEGLRLLGYEQVRDVLARAVAMLAPGEGDKETGRQGDKERA